MKKYLFFITIFFIAVPFCFSQNHISTNADGSAYIPLRVYKDVYKQDFAKKDLKKFKINGKDTLILIDDFEEFKRIISKKDIFRGESKAYMSLGDYKKMYKKSPTKKDSLNFKFRNNDTLVLVENYKPRGVSVPYEQIDSTLLEIYKDVVYKKYNSNRRNQKTEFMTLWTEPIKIYFSESVDKQYKKVIKELSFKISSEIDSLNISIVKKLEDSNYVIYQIDDDNDYKYSKNLSKNNHLDYYIYWNKRKIYDAKLEINTTKFKNIEKNKSYLMKIFIKSLGRFYNTSKLPCESIFSNCNNEETIFGDLDLKLLKYHYSYGICKRTNLEAFEENHKKAKETFLKTGRQLNFIHID